MVEWVAVMVAVVGFIFLAIILYGAYRLLKSVGESYIRWVTHVHEDEKRRYREGK